MKQFLDDDFLLESATALSLYERVKDLPIVDYHCHLSARELREDYRFRSITDVWLGADHYKWRLMRGAGVPEEEITGSASDWVKFQRYAEVIQKAIGNPLYHWSHLELRRFFGITDLLTAENARSIFDHANEQIVRPEFSARNLVRMSNVEVICTTDDPLDSLEDHRALADDPSFDTKVLPGFRPDSLLRIERVGFLPYVEQLEEVCGTEITSFEELLAAVENRIDFFDANGCHVADHSLEIFPKIPATDAEADAILRNRLAGNSISTHEADAFRWALMTRLAALYTERDWVMELHLIAIRDANERFFKLLGADTGFDAIGEDTNYYALVKLFSQLEAAGSLPRTILFTLDGNQNKALAVIASCYPKAGVKGYVQLGNAWWFDDTIEGMKTQISVFAQISSLDLAVGMVTDSRSFLSYPRHEYYRRIVTNMVGNWVESGQYPADLDTATAILRDVFHDNANDYFRFG